METDDVSFQIMDQFAGAAGNFTDIADRRVSEEVTFQQ